MCARPRPKGPPGTGPAALRFASRAGTVLLVASLLVSPARARREKASNEVSASLSGAASVISRWTDQFAGNRPEFEREFVLPTRLSVAQLDLFYDAVQPATVDLWLRSPAEDDRSARLLYRDLRAYILSLFYGESFFHDRPSDAISHRRTHAGDFYLRRIGGHPIHLFWNAVSLQGTSAYSRRDMDSHVAGARGDFCTGLGGLTIEVPAFRFDDHLDRRNEVQDTTYRVGLDRAYRDYYWSASYAARIGRLPYFLEDYVYEDFQAAGMAANVFGFDDLNVRLQLQYKNRPRDVVRNLHLKDYLMGDVTISIIPIERCSVQFGLARRSAGTRRLNPFGMALFTAGRIPSYADVEAVNGYERNEPLEYETYAKLHFNKWKRLTGHCRYSHVDKNQLPPSDLVVPGSTILVPHLLDTHEYKLSWTPGKRFGVYGMRSAEERRNDNRSIGTRSEYADVYAYLITFDHFTTSLGWSTWNQFASQPIVSNLLEGVKSLLVDLTWDLRNGFSIFANVRKVSCDGVREAIERIGETGVRFAGGGRAGVDGRISFAWNELDDWAAPSNDFSYGSVNMSAVARF